MVRRNAMIMITPSHDRRGPALDGHDSESDTLDSESDSSARFGCTRWAGGGPDSDRMTTVTPPSLPAGPSPRTRPP